MYIYLHSVLYTAYIEIKYMYKLYSVFLTYFMENLTSYLQEGIICKLPTKKFNYLTGLA